MCYSIAIAKVSSIKMQTLRLGGRRELGDMNLDHSISLLQYLTKGTKRSKKAARYSVAKVKQRKWCNLKP